MKELESWRLLERTGRILRGLALVMAGAAVLYLTAGCGKNRLPAIPDEGEQIVYHGLHYAIVQGETIHRPSPVQGSEYVFIPLTFQNHSDNNIIFSSYVCLSAYAVPSGTDCSSAQREAVSYGRQNIKDFAVFDGMIYAGRDTCGYLAFEVPENTQSVHVDFYTGYRDGECLSFDCKL